MIYLLCEIGSRDLESRILIGAHLLAKGRSVLIGHWGAVVHNAPRLPRDVYLFATANRVQHASMILCKNAGHKVAFTDEEALPLAAANLISANIAPESLETANAFFCNDENQRNIIKKTFGHEGTVTGSARTELWARASKIYADEARSLRAKGKYILINSTLASVNSVWKEEALKAALKTGADPTRIKADFEREGVDRENIVGFVKWAARELTSFRVVVRPHPAENADAWDEIKGIEVVKGSMSLPWILGADLVVHTNSTTGLEAAVLGRPCVNIAKTERKYAMEKVNLTMSTAEEAAKLALL